jgi:hypothetical protein
MEYYSTAEAMELIMHHFDGCEGKLREFIENADVFDVEDPSKHDILLRFVEAKVTGDAQAKLMVRFSKRNIGRKLCNDMHVRFLCL